MKDPTIEETIEFLVYDRDTWHSDGRYHDLAISALQRLGMTEESIHKVIAKEDCSSEKICRYCFYVVKKYPGTDPGDFYCVHPRHRCPIMGSPRACVQFNSTGGCPWFLEAK